MDYVTLKWIHILSSTFLFGTGVGSAFYLLAATLTRDTRAVAVTSRHVVIADWLFTATTAVLQPLTGYYLVQIAGFPWQAPWLKWSVILYVVAIACWLPVVWLQIRMRGFAQDAVKAGTELPPIYWRYLRYWVLLGIPAFLALVVVFYLMVVKPVF